MASENSTHTLDRRTFLISSGLAAGLTTSFSALGLQEGEADVPPGISVESLKKAEELLGITFTDTEREQMRVSLDGNKEIYDLLRETAYENALAPAETFDPRIPGKQYNLDRASSEATPRNAILSLPSDPLDIAYARVADLAHWIRSKQISSVELTRLYLDRLHTINERLECVITFTDDLAMRQAQRADERLARGDHLGPLHGLPWGAKDLLDTRDIKTTWGARPFKDRIGTLDAAVVEKLSDAGAVLIAKTTLGSLAYGDIWFDGRTNNPWNPEQGSSGSSAGSASATAAGGVAFSIGTETYGSIMSPASRCGASGFRPTFGRVSRHGAMALCWSLDKIGPICRSANCCELVLEAINGYDPRDAGSIDAKLRFEETRRLGELTIGYDPSHYEGERVSDGDRQVLQICKDAGCTIKEIEIPSGPFGAIIFLSIIVEGAAAFDRLTRDNQDDLMKWQSDQAWPNSFRAGRLIPAVEYMQARRLRRRYMHQMDELFSDLDIIIEPQSAGSLHALTNMTGQPALTFRTGFRDDGTPRANTIWGNLFQDEQVLSAGHQIESSLDIRHKRPPLFA
ncbi:MAG: amidase [Planctomycetota bacterium]|jgi:Asp-tRNA(Asn)/Glu-tRNA(Gln) amidotransferase A subunit family amidase